jgi:hypothetical protein
LLTINPQPQQKTSPRIDLCEFNKVEVKGEGVLENIMEAVMCNLQHSPSVIYI